MGGVRKPFLELAGRPVLVHALLPFLALDEVCGVAVALPADVAGDPPRWLVDLDPRVRVVVGGATRADSVAAALDALPARCEVLVVHDGARPLVSSETVRRCVALAATGVGAVAGVPAVDTMKRVDEGGRVEGTPERASLWHAHTPQAFPADVLRAAYAARGPRTATDDAALVEAMGVPVHMVEGERWNVKVTRPEDLPVAEALLATGAPRAGGAP
ncbi:MAG: 2-C-methyl-D-erythritol 4-phosphate cytidylyltransferase [Gemmatimonadetes bacterium]|nr:MAG: 2-C-methyl-D-erythritol 4-phosphate cytidylyltransferase [Gemmatimonadota bacterium]